MARYRPQQVSGAVNKDGGRRIPVVLGFSAFVFDAIRADRSMRVRVSAAAHLSREGS